ncbi:glycogen debranching enzyme-like isoform X2 [Saccostrea echinata]|uniref:glycogen debranching enzyme-like isoform X2 n=1 Tax=Saccostrea echinata TaxID=191078 RepID=UPI002A82DCC3|nr:glycogen debranching enzyme-like isoform X2 [Saccostrea echinata]
MLTKQIRVLTLNGGENRETTLYRLQKGWILRFNLGPSLFVSPVRLFCNHPTKKSEPFDRINYTELKWISPSGSKIDRHDVYAEVHINTAGSFNYYFTADKSGDRRHADGEGYFLVDPVLSLATDDATDEDDEDEAEELNLDSIQCQSVISKLLGPFPEWEGRLKVSHETGYNMIHFTPIQELGQSNSAYSIRNQLSLNPIFNTTDKTYGYDDVKRLVNEMVRNWKILSMTDLVLNHTANDSAWLTEHPECGYNLVNSPHLKPAFLVDRILLHFSIDVGEGKYESKGIPAIVDSAAHLEAIHRVLHEEVFPNYKLHEFYTMNLEAVLKEFKKAVEEARPLSSSRPQLDLIQDPQFRRNESTVDMNTALHLYNTDRPGVTSRAERIKRCCDEFRGKLEELNRHKTAEVQDHINAAVANFVANAKYRFVDGHGPRLGKVSAKEPLMFNYFVQPKDYEGTVASEEVNMEGDSGRLIMAVNGWVMGDDPLRNFADPDRYVYLRRELVPWGDSCKLRYGKEPKDCPYLWQHMKEYTETTVRIFHGVRLDNCHSTPIHVAEYMLDVARKIRPDLYVVAELFTGSESVDNIFMNKLGINSLIREAMSAGSCSDLGRLVYKYGGTACGSFIQPRVQPLLPTTAQALFFDQTHDNESPVEKRSPYDLFPSSAIVSMACCATGSNRGYDQLVPHHIHVVKEKRLYMSWATWDFPEPPYLNEKFGITAGKKMLNELHYKLGLAGYSEVFVDQLTHDTVAITRHNPQNHEAFVMVARTAFQKPHNPKETGYIRPVHVHGDITEIEFEALFGETKGFKYEKNPNFINGLPNYYLDIKQNVEPHASGLIKIRKEGDISIVEFHTFPPGSVIVFKQILPQKAKSAIIKIRRGVSQFGYLMRSYSGKTMFDETFDKSNFHAIISKLSLSDLNFVLYRCDSEERADGNGFGAYDIPGHGPTVYCGLRGLMAVLAHVRPNNDLGHPLCHNLREGNWLADYVGNRLKVHPNLKDLGEWFDKVLSNLKDAPRFLVPCYFDTVVTGAYVVLREQAMKLMSEFIQDGSTFVQMLSLGSVQFCGYVKNAKLPGLSKTLKSTTSDADIEHPLSLAAGFPHFASGYMRNWGRDTFIALRGLLLLIGRYDDAKLIILAYGGCLRHGLIPNLLNEGSGARYNCRDAVWWWLQAIQDYCSFNGTDILEEKVARLYPSDDSLVHEPDGQYDQPLHVVIQEALQRHAEGLKYRERNAGPQIDDQMSDEGFNNEIGVNWETGFVFGGNEHNCGTWMDKMGSSVKAGTKGKPATPRCGSAVELVGLSMSALTWLENLAEQKVYPYEGVSFIKNGVSSKVTFKEWSSLIKENFEKHFWINEDPTEYEPHRELINRRGIYKDSYYSKPFWADFQLRPNFPIAMIVAPQLFTPEHAWTALSEAEDVLLGPLGMKTLDPRDWAYVGDYDNSNDSNDPKVAHGFNYHQGPEWVWPLGYFLRAKLYYAKALEPKRKGILRSTISFIKTRLTPHYEHVMTSPWQSLPELTNSNGMFCRSSCPAQAWSVACILEVLYDLEQVGMVDDIAPRRNSADFSQKTVLV